MKNKSWLFGLFLFFMSMPISLMAAEAKPQDPSYMGIPAVVYKATESGGEYTVTIQIVAIMTMLTVLPSLLIMMTSFVRIIVVMAILRQAIGLQQTPSNQLLLGLALFLTLFLLLPAFQPLNEKALQPNMNKEITLLTALEKASEPFHDLF